MAKETPPDVVRAAPVSYRKTERQGFVVDEIRSQFQQSIEPAQAAIDGGQKNLKMTITIYAEPHNADRDSEAVQAIFNEFSGTVLGQVRLVLNVQPKTPPAELEQTIEHIVETSPEQAALPTAEIIEVAELPQKKTTVEKKAAPPPHAASDKAKEILDRRNKKK